jgi:hypothetical protein
VQLLTHVPLEHVLQPVHLLWHVLVSKLQMSHPVQLFGQVLPQPSSPPHLPVQLGVQIVCTLQPPLPLLT